MRWIGVACILLIIIASAGAHARTGSTYSHFNAKTGFIISPETGTIEQYTPHFNINYHNAWPVFGTKTVGDNLEYAYGQANNILGTMPDKVSAEVVGDWVMDETESEQIGAYSLMKLDKIVLRADSMKYPEKFLPVVEHELIHQGTNNILAEKKNDSGYTWMVEGVAQLISNTPALTDANGKAYIGKYGFVVLDNMLNTCEQNEDAQASFNAYYQSYSLCKYIADNFGMDTLIKLLKSPEENFSDGFKKVTGEDFDEFYQEWKDKVTDKNA